METRSREGGAATRCGVRPAADTGVTLVEVVVSTAVIGILMAALTSFFATMVRQTNLSGGQQAAVQLTTDGVEVIRAVPVADLQAAADDDAGGRWVPTVSADSENPEQPVRNNVRYTRGWTVADCWQPTTGGSCGAEAPGYVPFLRVVVAVTWPDRRCASARCSFTTSTLISNAPREPVFAQ